jgi:dienelactone hydrolase
MRAVRGASPPFAAAHAFYPGCGAATVTLRHYDTRVPLMVFHGDADEEVSADVCARPLACAVPAATATFKR